MITFGRAPSLTSTASAIASALIPGLSLAGLMDCTTSSYYDEETREGYARTERATVTRTDVRSGHEQRARRGRVAVRSRSVAAISKPLVLLLHHPHHQRRRDHRPAPEPPSDHHRRDGQGRGGARSWCSR